MIVVYAQWHSEIMAVLQGDFEEELRCMSVDRGVDRRKPRDSSASYGAHRYELEVDGQRPVLPKVHELLRIRYFGRRVRRS
jgi:hypothetical protein